MHPILARRGRLALYLALWVLVAGLLAALLAGRMGLTWLQAALVVLPIAAAYAFVCLSAWYVARSLPIASVGRGRRSWRPGIVASLLSSGGWLVMARPWVGVLVRRGWLPDAAARRRAREPDLRLRRAALSAVAGRELSADHGRGDAGRRAAGAAGAGAGARSGAAIAARADRSALPLQLPALDQRADDRRPAGGAADVPAARRFPARDAGARRRERASRWRAS